MIKNYKFFLMLAVMTIQGCASWKTNLYSQGDSNVAVRNAIIDFSHSSALAKNDTVFDVIVQNTDSEILGVSIHGSINKFIVVTGNDKDYTAMFPTRFMEYQNKLFFWDDENFPLSNEIIQKLVEYNHIDSVQHIGNAVFGFDDAKKGVDYFFCRKNLLKYKKVNTDQAMGNYERPTLDCASN